MKIKRICNQCKNVFHVEQSRLKHGRGKHCSATCQYKSRKGSKMTADQRKNMSNAQILSYQQHPERSLAIRKLFKGFKHSDESRKKMSESHKGKSPSNKGMPNPDMQGDKHPNWKGGKTRQSAGYVFVYAREHPFVKTKKRKYVLEHRLVMEAHLGRYLAEEESAHHINGVKDDNRIENLMLFPTESDHQKFHNL